MIDHVLGRPSSKFRKVQVFAVVSFWSLYLLRGDKHGPPWVRRLSSRLSRRITLWQSVVMTLLWLYVARNFAKITGLESPEPLANLYSRAFFRATWITTALDAGFWSAMKIRNKKLRDLSSILFTIYYLIAAEQADEKVRKIRAVMTVDHLRVSWDKPTTPYLALFTRLLRPRFTQYKPRKIRIPRPRSSTFREPVSGWMYFNGTLAQLQAQRHLVLDIPGGGFVAMNPRTSDDKLLAWAGKTGLPILSLDYKKAPEHPYPYALNECYDVYRMIVATRGRCIGIVSDVCPRIVLTGDSAGGNLATGTTLMIIQSNMAGGGGGGGMKLPSPAGLVLMYPALDMNITSWMTDDQMALIKNPRTARNHKNFIRRKSEDIDHLYTPTTPRVQDEEEKRDPEHDFFSHQRGSHDPKRRQEQDQHEQDQHEQDGVEKPGPPRSHAQSEADVAAHRRAVASSKPQRLKTRLAVSSIISYFGDRILTPEMMRAMIILYAGPYARPDFTTDHLLCPAVAPESLLTRFPKTYILTGERDPLVDDTVLFAGRLRHAKLHLFQERKDLGLEKSSTEFDEKKYVEVALIPGVSHGFVQFVSIYPEGWKHIFRCGRWIQQIFSEPPSAFEGRVATNAAATTASASISNVASDSQTASMGGWKSRLGQSAALTGDPGGSGLELNGSVGGGSDGLSVGEPRRHHSRTGTAESSGDEDRPLEMSSIHPGSSGSGSSRSGDGMSRSVQGGRIEHPATIAAGIDRHQNSSDANEIDSGPKTSPMKSSNRHDLPNPFLDSPSPASSTQLHPDLNERRDDSQQLQAQKPKYHMAQHAKDSKSQLRHHFPPPLSNLSPDQNKEPNSNSTFRSESDEEAEEGELESGPRQRHHSRHKSSGTTLGSEEDLLKRRMMGLTGSLMGGSDGVEDGDCNGT